jgi:hypothetical protein
VAVEMRLVETPVGRARLHTALADAPRATLVLGHGAGGGVGAADLEALAKALPARGVSVVRVEQPWHVAGRKVAAPPPTLDRAWLAVLEGLEFDGPLVLGGRSAGARVACRTAAQAGAAGVIALAFPLHLPGRPDRSRLPELDQVSDAGLPALVLQGTRDPFGGPDDIPAAPGRVVVPVPGGDHSFRAPKAYTGPRPLTTVLARAADWLDTLITASGESTSPRGG